MHDLPVCHPVSTHNHASNPPPSFLTPSRILSALKVIAGIMLVSYQLGDTKEVLAQGRRLLARDDLTTLRPYSSALVRMARCLAESESDQVCIASVGWR